MTKNVKTRGHVVQNEHRIQFSTGMLLGTVASQFAWLTVHIGARMAHSSSGLLPTNMARIWKREVAQNSRNQANKCGVPFPPQFLLSSYATAGLVAVFYSYGMFEHGKFRLEPFSQSTFLSFDWVTCQHMWLGRWSSLRWIIWKVTTVLTHL